MSKNAGNAENELLNQIVKFQNTEDKRMSVLTDEISEARQVIGETKAVEADVKELL